MWIIWLEKKILQTLGIIIGVLLVLLMAAHIYIVNNAEKLLEDIVDSRSNHKLKLHVKNLKFNYFSKKIELEQALFYTADSAGQLTAYKFSVSNIKIRVNAVLPIFTKKELRIDSLFLVAPDVEVIRLRLLNPSEKKEKKNISITEEMGRIYNSIMDALQLLHVNRFEFNDGKFTLTDKTSQGQQPLTITNLHFHVDNFRVDSTGKKDKSIYSDQMVFRTRNQDIIFPDGNHRLIFKRFRVNIRKRLIEIDSCRISGRKLGSSTAGFSVFFDTLKLTNFDFTALYQNELIKADSVYCINPDFKIVLESKTKTRAQKQIPNLDTLIQQLTGDLQLNYVGVKNASINFASYVNGKPNAFTSDKNNFEMNGLSIDHKAARTVSLQGFSMAIRNYENFIADSSYFLRFDSILLRNNKILLSSLSINTEPGVDNRNIKVNQFELSGLSWAELLFDKRIKAREATLYNPVIDYKPLKATKQKKKQTLFQMLGGIDKIMELERLRIVNGQIKLNLPDETELVLQNTNLVVNSNRLIESTDLSSIKHSVEELQFGKSVTKMKNLFAELTDAKFTGSTNQLTIRQARFYDRKQTINALVKNMVLNEPQFDEKATLAFAKGLTWEQARIELNSLSRQKTENKLPAIIHLENIEGKKTRININNGEKQVSLFMDNIYLANLDKTKKIETKGLKVNGKNFSLTDNSSELNITGFTFNDKQISSLNNFQFYQYKNNDTIHVGIPEVAFNPDINRLIDGSVQLQDVKLSNPQLIMKTRAKEADTSNKQKPLPELFIRNMDIIHPDINVSTQGKKGPFAFHWKGNNNSLSLENIKSEKNGNQGINIERLTGDFSDLGFTNKKGITTSSREGEIKLVIESVVLKPGDSLEWSAIVKRLDAKKFGADSVGKNNGLLKVNTGQLENFSIGSALMKDVKELISKNRSFAVSNITGYMINEKNDLRWYNFSFNRLTESASLDSFSFIPVISRDSFISASPYQTDYVTLKTGSVKIKGIDPDLYLYDSIFKAGNILITSPYFTSFRDKRPPFRHGIIKPLPPGLLLKIPFKVSIDTVQISNGTVMYSELNEKTNETGVIPVTRMSGDIFPIRNYNLTGNDTLRIRINGYLMDSAWTRLRVRQSYTDTSSGFLLTVRMRPGTLTYLNSALIPLSSVKLVSGYLDTLQMRAVGKDYLSFGEMRMYYHDMKVQFLKDGSETKKTFLTGLINFIANSFVIRKKNSNKPGVVYFPRLRDRSFINYYIKIMLSGVASSIGAKSNRKMIRKYRKELKQHKLPPIDYD